MEDDLFPWADFMVQLSWSEFFKNQFTKSLGPFSRCKFNVDQEELPYTKKGMCSFVLIYVSKWQLQEKIQVWSFLCLLLYIFMFSSSKIYYNNISLSWVFVLSFFNNYEHLFCLSHLKTCWTMSVNHVGLKLCLFKNLNLHGRFDIFFTFVLPRAP
jgi:hypothetical protein